MKNEYLFLVVLKMSRFVDTATGKSVDPECVSDQCLISNPCRVCGIVWVYKPDEREKYVLSVETRNGVHYDCADEATKLNWKSYKPYDPRKSIRDREPRLYKYQHEETKK